MTVDCYEITHSGEGERGEKVEMTCSWCHSAEWYAKQAADYFDGQEIRRTGISESGLDGSSRVVEVVRPGQASPERFRVRTRVVREYEATREGT